MLSLQAKESGRKTIIIKKPNKWGHSLKDVLREKAQKSVLYHTLVEIIPQVAGREYYEAGIPIITLGRWLFGGPEDRGQITVRGREDIIEIEVPNETPAEAIKLLMEAVNSL